MKPLILAALLFGLALALPREATAAVLLQVPANAGAPAIPVYVARPDGNGPFPAVLLLHGCGGIDGRLAVAADLLTEHGMVGVALDALSPHGKYGSCDGNAEPDESSAAKATLAWLRTQPYVAADRLALIGFSMGGDAALDLIDGKGAAPLPGLRAAIAYYPACDGYDGRATVPLAIFDGSADQVTPAAPCAAMVKAGMAAGKTLSITTYPGATHGFDVPGPDRTFFGQPIRYDRDASFDAALQTFNFLVRYLEP